ncbi:MAG: hypothetical protein V4441_07335 [Pseudomonadota bacterium]
MRNLLLAVSVASVGLLIAVAPAAALSTYEIQTDGGANFDGSPNETMPGGVTITSKTYNSQDQQYGFDAGAANQFNSTPIQQPELSKDMSWEGTGYYLRPDR